MAVLVDNSFSMCGERMDHAILAALCLYDFCMESEIPVLVCGHHTDGYRHENLKDETVYLHCCADFETDEKDGSGSLVCSLMEATGWNCIVVCWQPAFRTTGKAETAVCDQ